MQERNSFRGVGILGAWAAALCLAACGQRSDEASAKPEMPAAALAPAQPRAAVEVEVCGVPQHYQAVPQRAVTHDVNITEMFLYLGLGDRLVGYSGIQAQKEISPQAKPWLDRVPNLSPQGIGLEAILDARADFVFAGWSYGFRPGGVTPELLASHGVASYVISESCVHVQKRSQIALGDMLGDLRNIAKIFDVEQQAAPKIAHLQAGIDSLAQQMQGETERPQVFVYDSGEKIPVTVGRLGMPQAMLEAAGASNIFDDLERNWPRGNWEDVITRDPEWIVVIDYGTPSAQGKIDFLLSRPELAEVSAIRERRFFVMSYAEATPGPRNIETAQRLAAALHPQRQIRIDPVQWPAPPANKAATPESQP